MERLFKWVHETKAPEFSEESAKSFLGAFEYRVPWPVVQAIFRSLEIPLSRGMRATIDKLREAKDSAAIAKLATRYRDHILFGEKALRIYRFKGHELLNSMSGLAINHSMFKQSPFAKVYPLLLDDDALTKVPYRSFLTDAYRKNNETGFVFCSKRYVTERTEYDKEQLEQMDVFSEYDEVIAIRRAARQLFDVVNISPDGKDTLVEVRLDAPRDMNTADVYQGFEALWKEFARLVYTATKTDVQEKRPENLFPRVSALYDAEGDGRVCELGFTTDTGTMQHVKARAKAIDLRTEKFHKAGKKAVKVVAPYRIAVVWQHQQGTLSTSPEVLLPGNARMLSSSKRALLHAMTHGCAGKADYLFILDKMLN